MACASISSNVPAASLPRPPVPEGQRRSRAEPNSATLLNDPPQVSSKPAAAPSVRGPCIKGPGSSVVRARNDATSSRNCSGCSRCVEWLAPDKSSHLAWGSVSTSGRTTGALALSCSPDMTRTGSWISPSRGVTSQPSRVPMTWNSLETVHRVVDSRILLELRKRSLKAIRDREDAAQVALVEADHRPLILSHCPSCRAASWRLSVTRTSLGGSPRSRFASAIHSAIDGGELASTSERSPRGPRRAYCIASIPP